MIPYLTTCVVALALLASCELVEATRNVKEASRELRAETAEHHAVTETIRAATAQIAASTERLDRITAEAKDSWDRYALPALGLLGVGAFAFTRKTKHPAS